MNFHELVQSRYSVRDYESRAIPADALAKVLEAARLAPTAANRQPFRLIVVDTAKRKEELRGLYHRDWILRAPLLIFVCAVPGEAWVRQDGRNYALVDAAIVMDHLILAAADQGLQVGRDLAVTGFDDAPITDYLRPSLTSVRQPIAQAGEEAVRILLGLLHGETSSPMTSLLKPRLIVRDSTAPDAGQAER